MPSLWVQDRCACRHGSVHALGDKVNCYRDGDAAVCEALNGTVKAVYRDDDPVFLPEKEGYWSVCRVDARGARCWHEFRGGDPAVGAEPEPSV